MSNIVVAIATTTFFIDSQRVNVAQGSAWADDSPAVQLHPEIFSDDPDRALGRDLAMPAHGTETPDAASAEPAPQAQVEQATAEPGKKSNARRIFGR